MTNFSSHPDTYTGLPYLAVIDFGKYQHTAVIDFVHEGLLHYVHLEALDFDSASAFLVAVEEYYATSAKQLPLSVFLNKHKYNHVAAAGWRSAEVETIKSVVGPVSSHWFHCAKVKWRRMEVATGKITGSKNRRSTEQIESDRVAEIKSKEQKAAATAKVRADRLAAKEKAVKDKLKAKEAKAKAKRKAKLAVLAAIKDPVKRAKEELRFKHQEELDEILSRQQTARRGQAKIDKHQARLLREAARKDHVTRMEGIGQTDKVVEKVRKTTLLQSSPK